MDKHEFTQKEAFARPDNIITRSGEVVTMIQNFPSFDTSLAGFIKGRFYLWNSAGQYLGPNQPHNHDLFILD